MEPTPPCIYLSLSQTSEAKMWQCALTQNKTWPIHPKPKVAALQTQVPHSWHHCPLWLSPFQIKKSFAGSCMHPTHHALLPWIRSLGFQLQGKREKGCSQKEQQDGWDYYLISSTRWVKQQSQLSLYCCWHPSGYVPITGFKLTWNLCCEVIAWDRKICWQSKRMHDKNR